MMLGQLTLAGTILSAYLSAFSRLGCGRYTPAFYAYQFDRASYPTSTPRSARYCFSRRRGYSRRERVSCSGGLGWG